MSPEGWIVIGTIGGAIVGSAITGGFNIWKHYIDKRYESSLKRKEAVINAGMQTWAVTMKEFAGQLPIAPVELYIAHLSNLLDIILEDEFDKEKFKQALRENQELHRECGDLIRSINNPRT